MNLLGELRLSRSANSDKDDGEPMSVSVPIKILFGGGRVLFRYTIGELSAGVT